MLMTAEKRPPPFSMRLDPELRAKLEALAKAENRSLANMIETMLKESVAQRSRKPWDGMKP